MIEPGVSTEIIAWLPLLSFDLVAIYAVDIFER